MAKVSILVHQPVGICQVYMSVEFDTDRCVCRLNLVDGRMSVYRSINKFVSHICVSVMFDSESVKFGKQGIDVQYYLCETYL